MAIVDDGKENTSFAAVSLQFVYWQLDSDKAAQNLRSGPDHGPRFSGRDSASPASPQIVGGGVDQGLLAFSREFSILSYLASSLENCLCFQRCYMYLMTARGPQSLLEFNTGRRYLDLKIPGFPTDLSRTVSARCTIAVTVACMAGPVLLPSELGFTSFGRIQL